MNKTLVSVGIVSWNSARDLAACLQSLQSQTYQPVELIIVDNNSTDSSLMIVQESAPNAKIIHNKENRGFCGGHNQAIRASQGEFYLPLNPDIFLEPDYISSAVQAMNTDTRTGLVATCLFLGTQLDAPKRIDSTGLFIDRKRRQYLRGFEEEDREIYHQFGEVFGVDGAAPLYRRQMLEEICIDGQYFDELFFAHKEDVDVSWRARLSGWKCVYTPLSIAYHRRTFKPGKNRALIGKEIKFHAVKNRYLLLLKNETRSSWGRDWYRILWYDLKILSYILLFEQTSLKAVISILQNWGRIMAWRKHIQKNIKVSDDEILSWFKTQ